MLGSWISISIAASALGRGVLVTPKRITWEAVYLGRLFKVPCENLWFQYSVPEEGFQM